MKNVNVRGINTKQTGNVFWKSLQNLILKNNLQDRSNNLSFKNYITYIKHFIYFCSQIESDFDSLFPDKKSIFFEEWRRYKPRIMEYGLKKFKKNKENKELIALFSTEEGNF